jgi:DNA mismatch endonuclease (patch repair protein)
MDRLTPERRSANMRQIKSKGMKPEMAVRRLVHALGYRFRLHRRDLPGSPDLVFPGRRKVIFVHGCFWHQHPDAACRDARPPRSNNGYWGPKLARNQERDACAVNELKALGWDVLVLWECHIAKGDLEMKLQAFLN